MLPLLLSTILILVSSISLVGANGDDVDYPNVFDEADCNLNVSFSRDEPVYVLSSPDFPNDYPNGIKCKWNFVSMEHHYVFVTVEKVDMKGVPTPHCSDSDKILFTTPSGTAIGKICQKTHKFPPISMKNFSVIFESGDHPDGATINHGFRILLAAKPIYLLTCNQFGFELAMPRKQLPASSAVPYESYRLLDGRCKAIVERSQLVIRSFYKQCGTTYSPGVGYFNSVLMQPTGSNVSVTKFAVHCRSPGKSFIVSAEYEPNGVVNRQDLMKSAKLTYDVPTYSRLTNTLVSTVESEPQVTFHVEELAGSIKFKVTNHRCDNEIITARSCWITHTPHPIHSRRSVVLENGCPVHPIDRPFSLYNDSCTDIFILRSPTINNHRRFMYHIHCQVHLCSTTDADDMARCDRTCKPDEIPDIPNDAPSGRLLGVVRDAVRSDELSGVNVIAKSGQYVVGQTVTTSNGSHFQSLPAGVACTITFEAAGYHPATVNNVKTSAFHDVFLETILYIEEKYVGIGTVSGTIKNALNGANESNVRIAIREGLNTIDGPVVKTLETDVDGGWMIELETGYYTAQLSKVGFTNTTVSVTVLGGQNRTGVNHAIPPTPGEAETRIVLTWGEHPLDIDSHITGPIPDSAERFHVFWYKLGNITHSPFTNLDVDDTHSFGPETITIDKQLPGVYRYSVHDYSNRNATDSMAMAKSPVKVMVYRGNKLPETFHIPQLPGTLWTVFEISGNDLIPVNTMSYQNRSNSIA